MTEPVPSHTRRPMVTRAHERTLRTNIIEALRTSTFNGTVRSFAQRLVDQHGPAMPFDQRDRVVRFIARLERERVIAYRKRPKGAGGLSIVHEIRLVRGDAVEPTPRRAPAHHHRMSCADIERRQMQLLATLVHLGGRTASIAVLERIAATHYGDMHKRHAGPRDIIALKRCVRRIPATVNRMPTVCVEITDRGREMLARYRAAHDGNPKPPAPDGVRTRGVSGSPLLREEEAAEVFPREAPTTTDALLLLQPGILAAMPARRTLLDPAIIAARDAAVEDVLRKNGGTFGGAMPLAKAVVDAYPNVGTVRALEFHIQGRVDTGTLVASPHQHRGRTTISLPTPAPAPAPAVAMPAPIAEIPTLPMPMIPAPMTTVPSGNGTSPTPQQQQHGDPAAMLADVEHKLAVLAEERASLDGRQQKLERARERLQTLVAERDEVAAELRQ